MNNCICLESCSGVIQVHSKPILQFLSTVKIVIIFYIKTGCDQMFTIRKEFVMHNNSSILINFYPDTAKMIGNKAAVCLSRRSWALRSSRLANFRSSRIRLLKEMVMSRP